MACSHAVRNAMNSLNSAGLVSSLADFEKTVCEFLKDSSPPIFAETKIEIAKRALEVYTGVVAGEIIERGRRPRTMLLMVPFDQVIFSSSGREVKVPYFGVVKYRGNQKAIPVALNQGVRIAPKAYQVAIGYNASDVCLTLHTAAPPKKKLGEFGEQKLVRLSSDELIRRKKTAVQS